MCLLEYNGIFNMVLVGVCLIAIIGLSYCVGFIFGERNVLKKMPKEKPCQTKANFIDAD